MNNKNNLNLIIIILVLLIFSIISYLILSNGTYKSCYLKMQIKRQRNYFLQEKNVKTIVLH